MNQQLHVPFPVPLSAPELHTLLRINEHHPASIEQLRRLTIPPLSRQAAGQGVLSLQRQGWWARCGPTA